MLKVGFDFKSSGLTMRLRCSGHFLRVSEMRFQLTILINFDSEKKMVLGSSWGSRRKAAFRIGARQVIQASLVQAPAFQSSRF